MFGLLLGLSLEPFYSIDGRASSALSGLPNMRGGMAGPPVLGGKCMTTVVTGAGLIGTAFAQNAIARDEKVVFVDPEPRADFLKLKLGDKGYTLARYDVRD